MFGILKLRDKKPIYLSWDTVAYGALAPGAPSDIATRTSPLTLPPRLATPPTEHLTTQNSPTRCARFGLSHFS